MSVALRLKRARLAKGWSQKHLAATLGVTSSFITKIEAGDAYPSYERGLLMAQALDLPWDELWSAIEAERDAASRQRRQQRGAALQAMVTRGPTPRAAGGPAAPTPAVVPPPPPMPRALPPRWPPTRTCTPPTSICRPPWPTRRCAQ